MNIPTFNTEEYFGKYEFNCQYLMCASDCESISVKELIQAGGGSVEEFMDSKLGYPEMEGSLKLRTALSTLYSNISPHKIMVLGSPIEGIYLSMRNLLQKNDHAIALTPAYDALLNLPEYFSNNLSLWQLKESENKWKLDFEALDQLITKQTKLLIVNFPHNPTGFCPTKEDIMQIISFCRKYDLYLFSDEIYRGLELNENSNNESLADLYEKTISLGGFSKTLGLPGLRFGWLTVPNQELYQKLMNYKSYTSMCSNILNEYLGIMGVNAFAQIAERNSELIKNNISLAQKFFTQHEEKFKWIQPDGGSVSVMKILSGEAEKFCHELSNQHGIVLLPTKFMRSADDFIRIGLGRKNFDKCILQLDETIRGRYS